MTIDKAQLKALADELSERGNLDYKTERQLLSPSFGDALLGLLEEIDQLQEHKRGLIELRETNGFDSWSAALVEIDRLKVVNENLRHERDTLGHAIGEAVVKGGIAAPGFPLTGPQLLMFLEDLANDSVRMSTENEALRKDAERYRWLRDPDHQGDPESGNPKIICGYEEHEDIMWLDGLDAAIDTGMTQEDDQ